MDVGIRMAGKADPKDWLGNEPGVNLPSVTSVLLQGDGWHSVAPRSFTVTSYMGYEVATNGHGEHYANELFRAGQGHAEDPALPQTLAAWYEDGDVEYYVPLTSILAMRSTWGR